MMMNSKLHILATLHLQEVPSTHRSECLVGLEAALDTSERRIISYSSQKLRHKSSVAPPIASIYQQHYSS
jgi:hypothetical protein